VIFNIKIGRIIIRDYITKHFKEQLRKTILIEHLFSENKKYKANTTMYNK